LKARILDIYENNGLQTKASIIGRTPPKYVLPIWFNNDTSDEIHGQSRAHFWTTLQTIQELNHKPVFENGLIGTKEKYKIYKIRQL
jgi:hypothetical protein